MSSDIQSLEEQLGAQAEILERLATEPMGSATILETKGDDVRVATKGGQLVIKQPTDRKKKLKPGESILVLGSTNQYVRDNPFANSGSVAMISNINTEDQLAEAEINGRTVLFPLVAELKPGDRVILDEYDSFILSVLPRKNEGYAVPETGVTWDDIGGNHTAKQAMIEAIEFPHKYKELYEFYGTRGAKGILLYGPPGCGKTMLGKAAASSIGSAEGFIYCKGPEVLDPYVGVAEATVRSLFNRARRFKEETGNPAVIFIDEAEALLGNRGQFYAHMEKTIVPTFLAEMDGVEDSGAVVVLSTNRSMSLDPAIVRDGRIDRKVEIARPNLDDSKDILLTHLRHSPINGNCDDLAKKVVDDVWEAMFFHQGKPYEMKLYVSGAMLAGIVEKAKMNAIRRDIKNNTKLGIGIDDLGAGLVQTIQEMGATTLEELA